MSETGGEFSTQDNIIRQGVIEVVPGGKVLDAVEHGVRRNIEHGRRMARGSAAAARSLPQDLAYGATEIGRGIVDAAREVDRRTRAGTATGFASGPASPDWTAGNMTFQQGPTGQEIRDNVASQARRVGRGIRRVAREVDRRTRVGTATGFASGPSSPQERPDVSMHFNIPTPSTGNPAVVEAVRTLLRGPTETAVDDAHAAIATGTDQLAEAFRVSNTASEALKQATKESDPRRVVIKVLYKEKLNGNLGELKGKDAKVAKKYQATQEAATALSGDMANVVAMRELQTKLDSTYRTAGISSDTVKQIREGRSRETMAEQLLEEAKRLSDNLGDKVLEKYDAHESKAAALEDKLRKQVLTGDWRTPLRVARARVRETAYWIELYEKRLQGEAKSLLTRMDVGGLYGDVEDALTSARLRDHEVQQQAGKTDNELKTSEEDGLKKVIGGGTLSGFDKRYPGRKDAIVSEMVRTQKAYDIQSTFLDQSIATRQETDICFSYAVLREYAFTKQIRVEQIKAMTGFSGRVNRAIDWLRKAPAGSTALSLGNVKLLVNDVAGSVGDRIEAARKWDNRTTTQPLAEFAQKIGQALHETATDVDRQTALRVADVSTQLTQAVTRRNREKLLIQVEDLKDQGDQARLDRATAKLKQLEEEEWKALEAASGGTVRIEQNLSNNGQAEPVPEPDSLTNRVETPQMATRRARERSARAGQRETSTQPEPPVVLATRQIVSMYGEVRGLVNRGAEAADFASFGTNLRLAIERANKLLEEEVGDEAQQRLLKVAILQAEALRRDLSQIAGNGSDANSARLTVIDRRERQNAFERISDRLEGRDTQQEARQQSNNRRQDSRAHRDARQRSEQASVWTPPTEARIAELTPANATVVRALIKSLSAITDPNEKERVQRLIQSRIATK